MNYLADVKRTESFPFFKVEYQCPPDRENIYVAKAWTSDMKAASSIADTVQDTFSLLMAIPFFGHFVAQGKAVFSLAQITAGYTAALGFHLASEFMKDSTMQLRAEASAEIGARGFVSLGYSGIGYLTLGLVPLFVEIGRDHFQSFDTLVNLASSCPYMDRVG